MHADEAIAMHDKLQRVISDARVALEPQTPLGKSICNIKDIRT